jgi:GTP-binding protein
VNVHEATFLKEAPSIKAVPPVSLPEVAFAGRSNVGKSSLIARLIGRGGLVRVSRRPGRTRSLNFFDVTTEAGPCRFVDLPGYGYAEASKEERRRWGPLITSYLESRESLCLVVVLLDARREPSEQDLALFDLLEEFGRPTVAVATKIDKLSKSKVKPAVLKIAQATASPVLPFSSKTGEGRDELWQAVGRACGIV